MESDEALKAQRRKAKQLRRNNQKATLMGGLEKIDDITVVIQQSAKAKRKEALRAQFVTACQNAFNAITNQRNWIEVTVSGI